ncbi:uncharacterized protein LOC124438791 [Xenia sp. Carnegie-2017]|uniref:uncharacterized protein LOC124438791 n=1 Tax=Xenia sp. Carnegie-2017 TaxID=2897299 RepID=UPI001F03941B|nr:uncharacterized protein LOC124438791 [Xenia sp. Carnegie-2017]
MMSSNQFQSTDSSHEFFDNIGMSGSNTGHSQNYGGVTENSGFNNQLQFHQLDSTGSQQMVASSTAKYFQPRPSQGYSSPNQNMVPSSTLSLSSRIEQQGAVSTAQLFQPYPSTASAFFNDNGVQQDATHTNDIILKKSPQHENNDTAQLFPSDQKTKYGGPKFDRHGHQTFNPSEQATQIFQPQLTTNDNLKLPGSATQEFQGSVDSATSIIQQPSVHSKIPFYEVPKSDAANHFGFHDHSTINGNSAQESYPSMNAFEQHGHQGDLPTHVVNGPAQYFQPQTNMNQFAEQLQYHKQNFAFNDEGQTKEEVPNVSTQTATLFSSNSHGNAFDELGPNQYDLSTNSSLTNPPQSVGNKDHLQPSFSYSSYNPSHHISNTSVSGFSHPSDGQVLTSGVFEQTNVPQVTQNSSDHADYYSSERYRLSGDVEGKNQSVTDENAYVGSTSASNTPVSQAPYDNVQGLDIVRTTERSSTETRKDNEGYRHTASNLYPPSLGPESEPQFESSTSLYPPGLNSAIPMNHGESLYPPGMDLTESTLPPAQDMYPDHTSSSSMVSASNSGTDLQSNSKFNQNHEAEPDSKDSQAEEQRSLSQDVLERPDTSTSNISGISTVHENLSSTEQNLLSPSTFMQQTQNPKQSLDVHAEPRTTQTGSSPVISQPAESKSMINDVALDNRGVTHHQIPPHSHLLSLVPSSLQQNEARF